MTALTHRFSRVAVPACRNKIAIEIPRVFSETVLVVTLYHGP